MEHLFKKYFIWIVRYLPILSSTLIFIWCILILLDIGHVYVFDITHMFLLFGLSFIFKYCTYHKILILYSILFLILYYIELLLFPIVILYIVLYLILLIYGYCNKL